MPYPRPKPPAGGIKAPFPGFIEPALATSVDRVPAGSRWVHEIKFDGYRVQVHLRDAAVTRRGNDWTNRFRKIAADAWHINAGSAIIDGEVVVRAADGSTDFSVLQNELKGRSNKTRLEHELKLNLMASADCEPTSASRIRGFSESSTMDCHRSKLNGTVHDWPDWLRGQAAMYRKLAEQTDDPIVKNELLALAYVCDEIVDNIEDHTDR
jgi:hypothetical protein